MWLSSNKNDSRILTKLLFIKNFAGAKQEAKIKIISLKKPIFW